MRYLMQIFALSMFLIILSSCGVLINNDKFDSAKWKSGSQKTKGKMAYDLEKVEILTGKTESEVDEILGTANYNEPNFRVYYIDTNFPNNCYFDVYFDENTHKVRGTAIAD